MRVTKFGKWNHAMDRAMFYAQSMAPALVTKDDTGWAVLELGVDDRPVSEQVAAFEMVDPYWRGLALTNLQTTWGMTPAEGLVTACNPPEYQHFDVSWARARGDYQ